MTRPDPSHRPKAAAPGPGPSLSGEVKPPLRIVFMGTPALAAHILERLVACSERSFSVVAAVTRSDRPRGRGLDLEPSEVARCAARLGIATLKPEKVRTPEFLADLRALDPDLLVVAAYGRILPDPVLNVPRLMPINVHASLLPRHRGAAPVEGALLAGDAETGVTIMRMTSRMDAGPVLLQRALAMAADETQGSLKTKLAELGAAALIEALERLQAGTLVETPQDESLASYTSPVTKEQAVIDWSAEATVIERTTRAYDPWPVARTRLGGTELLIYRAAVIDPDARAGAPGTLVAATPRPLVQCGRGTLELREVMAPGRRRMDAADFIRGRRVAPGVVLGR